MNKHPQLVISLSYGLRDYDTKETKWFPNRSVVVKSELSQTVSTHFINCPACGGLIPDLIIQDKERSFRFTCTRIVENGKTIAKTDYAKLLFHLLAKELKTSRHFTKEDLDAPLRNLVNRLTKKKTRKNSHDTHAAETPQWKDKALLKQVGPAWTSKKAQSFHQPHTSST